MAREAGEQLARFGIDVDPLSRLGDLPIGLQQLIEIARVLFSGARIIILDEPTSALSPPEVERLFSTLRRLRDEGTAIVFISHFIEDILRVSDTVTVFRNGRKVAEAQATATSKAALIEAMIGKGREALEETYTEEIALPPSSDRPLVLEARQLSLGRSLQDVSFGVRAGEVLGIYGFMGCGQLELARILFGKLRPDAGELAIAGKPEAFGSTADARERRDRLRSGEPARHAVPPGAGLQEHLDQHPRSYFLAVAEAVTRTIDRHPADRPIADQAGGRRDRPRHAVRRQSAEGRAWRSG